MTACRMDDCTWNNQEPLRRKHWQAGDMIVEIEEGGICLLDELRRKCGTSLIVQFCLLVGLYSISWWGHFDWSLCQGTTLEWVEGLYWDKSIKCVFPHLCVALPLISQGLLKKKEKMVVCVSVLVRLSCSTTTSVPHLWRRHFGWSRHGKCSQCVGQW